MDLSVTGNYQELRDLFFKFRGLVAKKMIDYNTIPESTLKTFRVIRSKPIWNHSDAHLVFETISRFKAHLQHNSIDVTHLVAPKLQAPTRTKYTAKAQRLESITCTNEGFVVFLNYNQDKIKAIKQIPNRKYVSENRTWIVPKENAVELKAFATEYSVPIGVSARKIMDDYSNNLVQSYSAKRVETGVQLAEGFDFLDYQTVGVEFGVRMVRSWICDEMGLGKTLQGIGTALGVDTWPVLVLCPKSLRLNWKMEIEKFSNRKALVATPSVMRKINTLIETKQIDFLVMNYDGVKTFMTSVVEKVEQSNGRTRLNVTMNGIEKLFKGVIIDEIHEVKNRKAARFKIIKKAIDHMEFRQGLTGTPYVNKVEDLAAQLELIGRIDEFGGAWKFTKRYGKIKKNEFERGKSNSRQTNREDLLAELNQRLRTLCMIRREKHQVLTEMPDKMRRVVYCELSNMKDYDHAEINFVSYLQSKGRTSSVGLGMQGDILARMKVLQKISAEGKTETVVREVKQVLAAGRKAIVFVWHKQTIRYLEEEFPNLLEISGDVSDKKIDQYKQWFQDLEDPHNLIVITYKRGGVGHTLTAASDVFFHELGWNTKDQDQAEDRAHRIGQKNQVTCHYFLGKDTIDEHVYGIIQRKRGESSIALDSSQDIETSVENQVLNQMMNKNAEVQSN